MNIRFYQIQPDRVEELDPPGSSLDGITSSLPPGLYTTFNTLAHGTKVLGLGRHLQRLYLPSAVQPPIPVSALRKRISELAMTNLPNESKIRLIFLQESRELFIVLHDFTPLAKSVYENGVHVVTTDMTRHNPKIKGTDFISQSSEQRKLVGGDVFEVLLTKNDKILEGMTSNFYGVINRPQAIVTAKHGVLAGVTRNIILRIAKKQGLSIKYHAPSVGGNFAEAFLTSSSRGVVPIVRIDESAVGDERPGKITKRLAMDYGLYVEQNAERIS